MMPWFKEPFFQVALPIIITFALAHWHQNKRIDDLRSEVKAGFEALGKRIDEVVRRLERLEDRSGLIRTR